MKKKIFFGLAAVAIAVIVLTLSCRKTNNFHPRGAFAGPGPDCLEIDTVPTIIATGTTFTLTNDKLWILNGKSYVDSGAVLEVNEGTYVEAIKFQDNDSASAIVVTRYGKIFAQGTPENPIVFTARSDNPVPGEWGGLVLLGRAPLNRADTSIEGIDLPTVPVGINVQYGGGGAGMGDCNDNSGVVSYVRIEYAGAEISEANELNGLTCGGVGLGTQLDHIEVFYGNDDAFEFFGGCIEAKYLVAFSPDDDAFDFDFGCQAKIQFAISILDPEDDPFSTNPNGIESDNNATGAVDMPRTKARISNMTVIGFGLCPGGDSLFAETVLANGIDRGGHFRRASDLAVQNSLFMGFPIGIQFESSTSIASSANFKYNTVHAYRANSGLLGLSGADLTNALANNRIIVRGDSANVRPAIGLVNDCGDPCVFPVDLRPAAFSYLLASNGADGVNYSGDFSDDFFDVKAYRGALNTAGNGEDSDWFLDPWIKWCPGEAPCPF